MRASVEAFGAKFLALCRSVGEIAILVSKSFKSIFRYRFPIKEFFQQLLAVGNKSLLIVMLISFFTGLVIALQLVVGLKRFGLENYIGQLVGLSILRELGPVLTSIMLAARVGSGIAAELGSMVVTEQVMAIEAMGASPVQKLVVPRVLATIIAAPLLVVIADVIGVLGGMVIAVTESGVSADFYFDQLKSTLVIGDFVSGIVKAAFFGFFISIISCVQGLKAHGGTAGVGMATNSAVVYSSIAIFVSDFFLTKIILYI